MGNGPCARPSPTGSPRSRRRPRRRRRRRAAGGRGRGGRAAGARARARSWRPGSSSSGGGCAPGAARSARGWIAIASAVWFLSEVGRLYAALTGGPTPLGLAQHRRALPSAPAPTFVSAARGRMRAVDEAVLYLDIAAVFFGLAGAVLVVGSGLLGGESGLSLLIHAAFFVGVLAATARPQPHDARSAAPGRPLGDPRWASRSAPSDTSGCSLPAASGHRPAAVPRGRRGRRARWPRTAAPTGPTSRTTRRDMRPSRGRCAAPSRWPARS